MESFFIYEYCGEAFPEIGQLKNHECCEDIPQVNHNEGCFICEYCGEAFPEIGSFRNHNCCDNIPMSKCDECDFTSNKVPEIVRHVREAHRTYFQCHFCEYQSNNKENTTEHTP